LKELLNDGNVNIRSTAETAIRRIAERVRESREASAVAKAESEAKKQETESEEKNEK
jgi:hypothetical protein